MRPLIRLSCALGLGFVLAACSWQQAIVQRQEQEGRMARSLQAYVGRSVADVAQDRGPPTNTVDLGPNKRGFEWQITTETPEVAKPAPGSFVAATVPAGERTCLVSFVASTASSSPSLSDWIIESSQWKGESC
jgi:hypothetical protein